MPTTSLNSGDKLVISYNANNLVINLQTKYFGTYTTTFDTDILILSAKTVGIEMEVLARPISSPSDDRTSTILAGVESNIRQYIDNKKLGRTLVPEKFRQDILAMSTNISNLYVRKFRKRGNSRNMIEVIELNVNERAIVYETTAQPFTVGLAK